MLDEAQGRAELDVDRVEFFDVGDGVGGTFHCADCGYGITVQARLPRCPMCDGPSWERGPGALGVLSRLAPLDG